MKSSMAAGPAETARGRPATQAAATSVPAAEVGADGDRSDPRAGPAPSRPAGAAPCPPGAAPWRRAAGAGPPSRYLAVALVPPSREERERGERSRRSRLGLVLGPAVRDAEAVRAFAAASN